VILESARRRVDADVTPLARETTDAAGEGDGMTSQIGKSLHHFLLVAGALTLLCATGLLLTNYSAATALSYWSLMFPAFGLVALWLVVTRSGRTENVALTVVRVAAHWLGPLIALRLLFLQLHRGQMDADAVGATTLLLLAVTSFLAGIYQDRLFFLAAALLALGTFVATEIEAYIWLVVIIGILALAAIVGGLVLWRRTIGALPSRGDDVRRGEDESPVTR
jgi:hypothetical protein